MQATAAWQAAWGVTEFTLYYSPHDRPTDTYRAYCEYVGRLNAVLKPARMDRRVLLYYPIRDLWTEYLPVAEPLRLESQSARAQQIVGSLMRLGRALQRSQIPFALIDHERLAGAQVSPGGKLVVAGAEFESLVVPEGVEFSEAVAVVVERFCQAGGRVVRDSTSGPTREGRRTEFIPFPDGINSVLLRGKDSLRDVLQPAYRIAPPSDSIALGQFSRDGRQILLLVNVGSEGYQGRLIATQPKTWLLADPAGGSIQPGSAGTSPQIELRLPPRNAVFAVEVQAGRE
jgi:hypothetical protein